MRRVAAVLCLMLFVCTLQSCGVRRDLRLPEKEEPKQEERHE